MICRSIIVGKTVGEGLTQIKGQAVQRSTIRHAIDRDTKWTEQKRRPWC